MAACHDWLVTPAVGTASWDSGSHFLKVPRRVYSKPSIPGDNQSLEVVTRDIVGAKFFGFKLNLLLNIPPECSHTGRNGRNLT